jgi:hypothetical protein
MSWEGGGGRCAHGKGKGKGKIVILLNEAVKGSEGTVPPILNLGNRGTG